MRAVGANTLLFQPVRNAHKTVGAIVLEDPGQPETMEHIIAIVGSIVALRFAKPFDAAAGEVIPVWRSRPKSMTRGLTRAFFWSRRPRPVSRLRRVCIRRFRSWSFPSWTPMRRIVTALRAP